LPGIIEELLTPLGLALWIMGDGYWNNGVILCNDNFRLAEVQTLIKVLDSKFSLKVTINNVTRKNSKTIQSYRIRINGEKTNLNLLKSLVLPYFIPSMLYKLGINE
jgi:hypothetical protein